LLSESYCTLAGMDTYQHSKKKTLNALKPLLITGGAVFVCGFSFYGGVLFQKSKTPATQDFSNTSSPNGAQTFNGPRRMMISEVTAVSGTSITVTTESTSKTYTINGDTIIRKDGATAAATDITVGDKVLVIASNEDSSVAQRIDINPTLGNGPMMQYDNGSGVQSN